MSAPSGDENGSLRYFKSPYQPQSFASFFFFLGGDIIVNSVPQGGSTTLLIFNNFATSHKR